MNRKSQPAVNLPKPKFEIHFDLNHALQARRSIREYSGKPLTLDDLSQLLWAAQGIDSLGGYRTAPSAGALYPLEIYALAGQVDGLTAGIYHYDPKQHTLTCTAEGDRRAAIAAASLGQGWMANAAAMIVVAAVFERTTEKYGERGTRYVYMEAGHVGENVELEATALNLGAVVVGAFTDKEVKKILGLPEKEAPLYLIPVGKK